MQIDTDILQTEFLEENLKIKKKLGEGTQGTVFMVDSSFGPMAMKWYHPRQATQHQLNSIRYLIKNGPPPGEAGKRFIWPMDVVFSNSSKSFGYLMKLYDTQRYCDIGLVFAKVKSAPTVRTKCRISYELVSSYRQLHLSGYCYRDISAGNFVFDSKTGDVLICDNDNVGVNGNSKCQVLGTMEYMAPELIFGRAKPSIKSDLYSLSVLLFQLWMWHHPLHGKREYNLKVWDIPAKKYVYGNNPIFIFDPFNKTNRLPEVAEYNTPKIFWEICPDILKSMFLRSFTEDLHKPDSRITEGEWQEAFLTLSDTITHCPRDKAENFWQEGQKEIECWYCKNKYEAPVRLRLSNKKGIRNIVIDSDSVVYSRHIKPFFLTDEETAVGKMVQNPQNPSIWGLCNQTDETWTYIIDGTKKKVPPFKAIPVSLGIKIDFGNGTTGEFVL